MTTAHQHTAIPAFDVLDFEWIIQSGYGDKASDAFVRLMTCLDERPGTQLHEVLGLNSATAQEDARLATRVCAALGHLMAKSDFTVALASHDQLMQWQAQLSSLFALSGFGHADHVLMHLLRPNDDGVIQGHQLVKAFLLFSNESPSAHLLLPFKDASTDLFFATCLMLIWSCSGSKQSCLNREWALEQATTCLRAHPTLNIPKGLIHGYYMHCSYALAANKHDIKALINQRLSLEMTGFDNLRSPKLDHLAHSHAVDIRERIAQSGKPVLLVIPEMLSAEHSVYRVLGPSILACKEKFFVVCFSWPGYVNPSSHHLFDACIESSGESPVYCTSELLNTARFLKPAAVYYPSIGMTPWVIHYANLRLAPVQLTTVGHAASSHATQIDYFLAESDIAGSPDTYSERLIALPPRSMPFVEPKQIHYAPRPRTHTGDSERHIQIACCMSWMKINSTFLELLQRIQARYAKHPEIVLHWNFFLIFPVNLSRAVALNMLAQYLPQATVHQGLGFQTYIDQLGEMDISLSPFPYGNMNGLIDCARLGIPGVCMQGKHIHEAIDAGMWRRMGVPAWLIANDETGYEEAVCRLIDNPDQRQLISEQLVKQQTWRRFFDGDATAFANCVHALTLPSNHEVGLIP